MNQTKPASDTNRQWARRTLYVLLGVFAVVLAVNLFMVFAAIRSSNGVVSATAYEEGLAYNQTLHQQAQQQSLGWQLLRVQQSFPAQLEYSLKNAAGAPISAAQVQAHITRPLADAPSHTVVLAETTSGTYAVSTSWPAKGQWNVELNITHAGQLFKSQERVIVP